MRIPQRVGSSYVRGLLDQAFKNRNSRIERYKELRSYYETGAGEKRSRDSLPKYNKIAPYIEKIGSYLFSGETTMFSWDVSRTISSAEQSTIGLFKKAVDKRLNDAWHDAGLDRQYALSLIEALVQGSVFVKLRYNRESKSCEAHLVRSIDIGVLREDIENVEDQPLLAHSYMATLSDLHSLIYFHAKMRAFGQMKKGDADYDARLESTVSRIYNEVARRIFDGEFHGEGGERRRGFEVTGPGNQADPTKSPSEQMYMSINYNFYTSSGPLVVSREVNERMFEVFELWVYDDKLKDYRMFVYVEPGILLVDAVNPVIPGVVPFCQIKPYPRIGDFFGASAVEAVVPVQEWLTERISQIQFLLTQQIRPPIVAQGISGLDMDAMEEFYRPEGGGFLEGQTAKVDMFRPPIPQELFGEEQQIERIFNEMGGMDGVIGTGRSPGVRSAQHAGLLARLESSRLKATALLLERSMNLIATHLLELLRRCDPSQLYNDEGNAFVLSQVSESMMSVRVDSHSASPLFVEDQKEMALEAFKLGLIDGEDALEFLKLPGSEMLQQKFKEKSRAAARADAERTAKEDALEQKKAEK